MPDQNCSLRRASEADAEAIAAVFSPSFRLLDFLPPLHTVAEDRWFIANVILKECAVTLAECEGRVAAFLALQEDEIRLLHTHPDFIGRELGARLLQSAKDSGVGALELWCFQANHKARRFYERHGFRAIRFTDGAHNEEKMPDVRYRWERH